MAFGNIIRVGISFVNEGLHIVWGRLDIPFFCVWRGGRGRGRTGMGEWELVCGMHAGCAMMGLMGWMDMRVESANCNDGEEGAIEKLGLSIRRNLPICVLCRCARGEN